MRSNASSSWIPVALSGDIPNGTVIPGILSSKPIAIWRSQSGRVNANGDRCPHRGMRLSHGFVRGETLSCIYHGWRFGQDGACQHIPAHPDVVPPASINCGPMQVAEQDGVIWVAEEQTDADPSRLEGLKPLRSLVFRADPKAILAASGGTMTDPVIEATVHDTRIGLLLHQQAPGETLCLAMIDQAAPSKTCTEVSRALEGLRRRAEAGTVQRGAA